MASDRIASTKHDDLPEPVAKVVAGVSKAGEVAGTAAGGLFGVPLALAAKGISRLCGKSAGESDDIADRVFAGSIKVGKGFGKVAPLTVLAAPVVLAWKLGKRK